jgi:hypothetical protein
VELEMIRDGTLGMIAISETNDDKGGCVRRKDLKVKGTEEVEEVRSVNLM